MIIYSSYSVKSVYFNSKLNLLRLLSYKTIIHLDFAIHILSIVIRKRGRKSRAKQHRTYYSASWRNFYSTSQSASSGQPRVNSCISQLSCCSSDAYFQKLNSTASAKSSKLLYEVLWLKSRTRASQADFSQTCQFVHDFLHISVDTHLLNKDFIARIKSHSPLRRGAAEFERFLMIWG